MLNVEKSQEDSEKKMISEKSCIVELNVQRKKGLMSMNINLFRYVYKIKRNNQANDLWLQPCCERNG